MLQLLSDHPLVTFFFVVAAGAAIGAIRFGPVRFGAAGALFVGLVLSALTPALAGDLTLMRQLGLALFVYTVGVASGSTFLSGFKRNLPLLVIAGVTVVAAAGATIVLGHILAVPKALTTGIFTGALTAAPALDLATALTGDGNAAVGYSFGYPIGVVVGIVFVTLTAGKHWADKRDTPSLAGLGLTAITVRVEEETDPHTIEAWRQQKVRLSYVRRGRKTRVLIPGEPLLAGDEVVMVGDSDAVREVARQLGSITSYHLADDRTDVSFERVTVSNPMVAGRTIADVNLPVKYGGLVTRVRRGDLDLLARDDLPLQLGDHVAVVVPRGQLDAVQDYFGDSQSKIAEVDALALGLGLTLGLLFGLIPFPLPGGQTFQLGSAAGPLIIGMVLGGLRRTGPLVWVLPSSANLTIRQLGLLFFLAALGLGAGPSVRELLTSEMGWKAALVALVVVVLACGIITFAGRMWRLSAARTAGGVAGFLGQPAVLQAANAQVQDERIESAYAALFAATIIAKILLVPLVWIL